MARGDTPPGGASLPGQPAVDAAPTGVAAEGEGEGADAGVRVRRATPEDLAAVARLAAALVRLHHRWDPLRFMLPEPLEEGYRWWLGRELADADAIVLVAERGGDGVIGYAYGRIEERDWNALLDSCGAIHDLYVDEGARHLGVARALVRALLAALEERGAPRVVLGTAWQNETAQALFRSLGFRPTMIEMTRERGAGPSRR